MQLPGDISTCGATAGVFAQPRPEPDIAAYDHSRLAKSVSHPLTAPCQFDMIVQDKKVKRGKLTFILARAIGIIEATSIPSKCALPQDLSE
jgi:3-dehydroquinate synthetase